MGLEATASRAGRSEYAIVDALNRDWHDLVHRHRGTVARWAERHTQLTLCDSLDDVLSAGKLNSDATFSALLTEVSNGDEVAGRTVLQALLGRLIRMAQRDGHAGVDDYIAALWCVIQTYPLQARPTRIAANLSMDAFKILHREREWLRQGVVTPWPPDRFLDESGLRTAEVAPLGSVGDRPLTAGEVLDAGLRLRLIDEPTRKLLHSVYVDGLSGTEAARLHRTSPGSLRARSSKAVNRLAASSAQLAEAA